MKKVVCAVIEHNSRFLIAKRPAHKAEGLRWEFPGGKVEAGETEHAALIREIREELSIDILPIEEIGSIKMSGRQGIVLVAWKCAWRNQVINLTEHVAFDWVFVDVLRKMDLSNADKLLLPKIESYFGKSPI